LVLHGGEHSLCFEAPRLLDKHDSVTYDSKERYVLFSGGFTEVGFILFIAFLLFGPKKLPEIARILGKGMGELRRASNELKSSLEEEIRNLDRKDEDTSYSSYSQHETEPYETHAYDAQSYTELEEEGFEHPEEPHELSAESEETTVSHPPEETETALSTQPEGDLEPAPEYEYDYSEPSQQEPEPRPRG
jgi:TatA/E family protein of Tat protein translocase